MSAYLMDFFVPNMRKHALRAIYKSYRPDSVTKEFLQKQLKFQEISHLEELLEEYKSEQLAQSQPSSSSSSSSSSKSTTFTETNYRRPNIMKISTSFGIQQKQRRKNPKSTLRKGKYEKEKDEKNKEKYKKEK
eukprot:TRINITY_DN15289_c0_g1_i1.p1 TRINITY_DN15289_c0_g1~~TRINITY_DN15289_c0_g1_i1.p1  ORF type:complete len:153 (+),score=26.73 TRINITY_DN15289_c0_g1_i1:62-460(+)